MNTPADKKPNTSPPPTNANVARGDKGPPPTPSPTDTVKATPSTDAKVEPKPEDKPDDKEGEGEAGDKAANRSKFFIVVGQVHEFETIAKAEAFLNGPDGPKTFQVIRGHEVKSKQRVSLRG